VARSYHQLTARLQHPGRQLGGDKRLAPPGGEVHRVEVAAAAAAVVVLLLVPAAAAGGLHQQVEGVQHGVETQVLGDPLQQAVGVPTQRPVRGVQEAVAGGEQAAQLETLGGPAQIHKRKVVGTCDAYCLHLEGCTRSCPILRMISDCLLWKTDSKQPTTKQYIVSISNPAGQ